LTYGICLALLLHKKEKMKNLLSVILLSATMVGCSSMKRPVSEQDALKISNVATVSLLGNEFHNIKVGTTVFNNYSFIENVPDWKIDELAAREAAVILSKSRGTSVLPLEISQIDSINTDSPDEIEKKISKIALRSGIDTVVIIRKAGSSNYPFLTPGFGYFERSVLSYSTHGPYTMFITSVVDTKSQKEIAWEWGIGVPCGVGCAIDVPMKKSFNEYSNEEIQRIRSSIEADLKSSIRYSLTKLGLTK
jgi:hypothetical protein